MLISSFEMKNSENSQGSFHTRVVTDYYITGRERRGLKFQLHDSAFEYSSE